MDPFLPLDVETSGMDFLKEDDEDVDVDDKFEDVDDILDESAS